MKTLTFIKHHGPYNPDDVATFTTEQADRLIAAGVAVAQSVAQAVAPAKQAAQRNIRSKILTK